LLVSGSTGRRMDFLLGPLKRYLASMLQSRLAEYFENIELDGELHTVRLRAWKP